MGLGEEIAALLAIALLGALPAYRRFLADVYRPVPEGLCQQCSQVDALPGSRTCASPDCTTDDDWQHNA